MLRSLGRRDAVAALIIFVLVLLCTYLTLRVRVTYGNETQIVLLRQELLAVKQGIENDRATTRIWEAEIERTLYAQPAQKPEAITRRPSALEQWQINQYKDITRRLTVLERWRYETER